MSLLDDARWMAANRPHECGEACWWCNGGVPLDHEAETPPRPDCPWTRLPKIVAALEAAEDVAGSRMVFYEHVDDDSGHYFECPWCDARADCDCTERARGYVGIRDRLDRIGARIEHVPGPAGCEMERLAGALRGEGYDSFGGDVMSDDHDLPERAEGEGSTITRYDVFLERVGPDRVGVMRALREYTPASIGELRPLLDDAPAIVLGDDSGERAFPLTRALVSYGAGVRLVQRQWEIEAGCFAEDATPRRLSRIRTTDIPRRLW